MFERGHVGAGSDYTPIDEGIYVLRFDGIEAEKEWPPEKDGDTGTKSLFLRFVIEDPHGETDYDGREVKFWFPARFTTGNKTGRLFAAMFGGELPATFDGDEEELYGRRLRAVLKNNAEGYLRLESALPVKSRRQERQEALVAGGEPPF